MPYTVRMPFNLRRDVNLKRAIGGGICLSLATTFLILTPAAFGPGRLGYAVLQGAFVLAPGYIGYGYLRGIIAGPLNVHQDVGEWALGGFVLNTLIWALLCTGLRAARVWRERRRRAV
jgi:hypothetical protein